MTGLPAVPPPHAPADRPVRWRRAGVGAGLGALAFGLLQLAAAFPAQTERVYALAVYPYVQATLATLAGCSPVALGETLLLGGSAVVLWRALRAAVAVARRRRSARNVLAHALTQALCIGGVLALAFQLLWGLNHARLPFASQLGLSTGPATVDRLARVTQRLAARAAAARPAGFDVQARSLPPDWREHVAAAYVQAGTELPVLAGPHPPIRQALISPLLTLMAITGIYSPFTGEANVNDAVPDVLQPFVACHEVAHLRGYAREDEADFIGWWVGTRSADPLLVYSCELHALRQSLFQLARTAPVAWVDALAGLPRDVRADLHAIDDFWAGRPPMASKVLTRLAKTTNDLYLKSSGHADGVHSYGRMVDLLIAVLDR